MDPEWKKLLEETFSLEKENNKILHAMRRSMFWSRVMNCLYWIIIIGVSVGAFYFLQPYMDKIVKMYGNASAMLKNFQNLPK